MQENVIGKHIRTVREEKNYSQKDVCRGLCSVQTLSKIEAGERMPDVFLFDGILSRLGLAPDDYEKVLFDDEYQEIALQDLIEDRWNEREWEQIEEILENSYDHSRDSLKGQYYWQIRAMLASVQDRHESSIECLERALECTKLDDVTIKMQQVLLTTRELQLLCMLADERMKLGQLQESKRIVAGLLGYLEKHEIKDMELVKTYPKVVYLNAHFVSSQSEKMELIVRCEKALNLLVDCGTTIFLAEIMQILIDEYEVMNLTEKTIRLKKQLESLEQFLAEYGLTVQSDASCKRWFVELYRKEYLLCEEIIKGERLARGLKHKDLIEGIYEDPETLIRIENGSQSPSYKKYQMLMERLNLNPEKYRGVFQKRSELSRAKDVLGKLYIQHRYEDAKLELEKIKLLVKDTDIDDEQYIAKEDAFLDFRLKKIDASEWIARLNAALALTYKGNWEDAIRVPTLAEVQIFLYLFIAYRSMERNEECFHLFKIISECFNNSKLSRRYQYRALTLLHRNRLVFLEELGYCDEGLAWADEVLRYEHQAGRGRGLDYICSEIACIYEQCNKEKAERYLRYAFYLSDLFKRDINNKKIDNYYRKNYDSMVQWY